MPSERDKQLVNLVLKSDLTNEKNLKDLFDLSLNIHTKDKNDIKYCLKITEYVNKQAEYMTLKTGKREFDDLYWNVLRFEAPHLFDSYLIYLERNRLEKDRFYLPKRRHLIKHGIIQVAQDLEDDVIDIASISMPPGTQKTTFEKFFASWIIGKHPDDYSLFYSHSDDITRMFYDGVLSITTDSSEYTWNEIFPDVRLESTNAKRQIINFNNYKPFANLQCSAVGAKNAGKVRCNRYLYCDDLIGGIEEALNKTRLDSLWNKYSVDARQRKKDGCKELHIATRWSVHDVIGRIKNLYEGSNRTRFIAIPDIDPTTGKSNFDYEYEGFTVEFFNDQALAMDDVSYRCLFKNEPIEREGLLYTEDELRRYVTLPMKEPDAILGICDTKNKGTDYLFLPCLLQYGDDFYCVDCVCDDNSDYGVQYERVSDLIVRNKMQAVEFESNNGGDRVAYEVSKRVEKKGWTCNITEKPTESNKETKIIVNAYWVKKHVIFKDKSKYTPKDDYGKMMSFLLSYSVKGKNPHDDVPDGFACFALFIQNFGGGKVKAIHNPLWGISR